jgi:hypothetical protein
MAISRMQEPRQLMNNGGILTLEAAKKMAPPGESLAYINKDEAKLLKSLGGAGEDINGTGIKSYFIKKALKSITRPIKKVLKSPIGKIGLMALGGYGLGGGFGAGGFKFGNLLSKGKGLASMFSKAKNALTGSNLFKGLTSGPGILAAGLGSGLLGGLLAKQPDEDEDEYQDRIMRLQPYLKQYYGNVGDTFGDQKIGPNELEDFVTSQSIEYQGAKDGGLMGYEDGGVIMADVDEMKVGPKGEEETMEEEVVEQDDMSEPMTGIEKVADSLRDIAMVLYKVNPTIMPYKMAKAMYDRLPDISKQHVDEVSETMIMVEGKKDGGIMNLGGKEMDLRSGGFVPLGKKERADDVPARLSKNEFVFTADAVRAAGGGSVQKGAQKMYDTMKMLEKRIK